VANRLISINGYLDQLVAVSLNTTTKIHLPTLELQKMLLHKDLLDPSCNERQFC
jgi:hypothetical protein